MTVSLSRCGLLLLAMSAATPVLAQSRLGASAHGTSQGFVAQYDADGDGRVTLAEFEQARRARYDGMDADGDGRVTEAEYVGEYRQRQLEEQQATRHAQVAQTLTRHAALDADKDGHVSRAEYDASGERIWANHRKQLQEAPKATGERPRSRELMPTTHSVQGMLALYDADGDGKVDEAEFRTARDAAFKATDRDGDGRLDLAEYLAEYLQRLEARLEAQREGGARQAHVRFGVLDGNKDGNVAWEEFAASGRNLFSRADTDFDGAVDASDSATPDAEA